MSEAKSNWDVIGALAAAAITVLLLGYGMTGGSLLFVSFPIQIVGILLVGWAIWRHRKWWLLVLLPVLSLPLVIWLAILYSCAQGDCL